MGDAVSADTPNSALPTPHSAGGSRELLKLALPLILANSFTTIQFTVDRAFLSRYDPDAMGASMPGAMVFWLFQAILFGTAGYTTTFVAQYTGAARLLRVGPAVWQGVWFGVAAGMLFFLLWPFAPQIFALTGHGEKLISLETQYFRSLLPCAVPMAITAAVSGFFSGRGDTWVVLGINALGTVVNAILDYLFIAGRHGCPELGISGAGWATAIGSWASAIMALALFLRPRFEREYATRSGWKLETELFQRLLKFGFPAGLQWALEALAFTFFTVFVGQLGEAAANATSLTFTLNMFAFLPMMGVGQAVSILVGQRLGEDKPDLAERSTHTAAKWAVGYMIFIAGLYLAIPEMLVSGFEPAAGSEQATGWPAVVAIVPTLLMCVAAYSLLDALNLTYSFALRGAGDTKFVTWLTFALAWPLMVGPTFAAVNAGGTVYWCWVFATLYIGVIAVCFFLRFRTGKWRSMRVIEPEVGPD
jgi:multidrug resistance protein, MATE family